MAQIGAAVSGGGYRASAWGLGALLAIVDATAPSEVPGPGGETEPSTLTEVASVSGGSITNAWLGLGDSEARCDEFAGRLAGRPAMFRAGLVAVVAGLQLAWALAPWLPNGWLRFLVAAVVTAVLAVAVGTRAGDVLFGRALPWLYTVLLGMGIVGLVWVWVLPWAVGWRALLFVAAVLAWSALLAQRGRAVDLALRRVLRAAGRTAELADLGAGVQRVFCATELHAGHNLYLLREDAYNYDLGVGSTAGVKLSTAVQCSANLPGAFPVRWLRARPFGFAGGTKDPCSDEAPRDPPFLALTDGGVYDNMADQWHLGFGARAAGVPADVTRRWSALHADLVVVANASAALPWAPRKRAILPLAGEVSGLLMAKDVLYDQTTSIRRRELIVRFDAYLRHGPGEPGALAGTLVHIASSPWSVPFTFDSDTWPEAMRQRARTAKEALGELGITHEQWRRVACDNKAVGTQLWPLGVEATARLIHHAYVQTAVNLYIIHGLRLPRPLPTLDSFRARIKRTRS